MTSLALPLSQSRALPALRITEDLHSETVISELSDR